MSVVTEKTWHIPSVGIGRPDYSEETHRGKIFKKIELKQNEIRKLFSATYSTLDSEWSWVQDPIAPGESGGLIDISTGFPGPYIIPVGFSFNTLLRRYTADQLCRVQLFAEGYLIGEHYPSPHDVQTEQEIGVFSTKWIDPLATSPHIVDMAITNLGDSDLHGGFDLMGLQKLVGSKMPTEKTVRCKWCGYTEKVPYKTTSLTCPKCGKTTLYML